MPLPPWARTFASRPHSLVLSAFADFLDPTLEGHRQSMVGLIQLHLPMGRRHRAGLQPPNLFLDFTDDLLQQHFDTVG